MNISTSAREPRATPQSHDCVAGGDGHCERPIQRWSPTSTRTERNARPSQSNHSGRACTRVDDSNPYANPEEQNTYHSSPTAPPRTAHVAAIRHQHRLVPPSPWSSCCCSCCFPVCLVVCLFVCLSFCVLRFSCALLTAHVAAIPRVCGHAPHVNIVSMCFASRLAAALRFRHGANPSRANRARGPNPTTPAWAGTRTARQARRHDTRVPTTRALRGATPADARQWR